ncbi:caspase domain-containing protein [Streptomyces atratus]|uniref:caspase family protein n=1 Tax=Streptomyces atratus TaxID=1893 RepID=UPI00368765FA
MFTQPDLPNATVYADVVAALARRSPWGDEDEICDRMSRLWLAAYQYKALDLEPSIDRMPDGEDSAERSPAATTRDDQLASHELAPRSIPPTNFLERHPEMPSLDHSCAVIVGVGRFRDPRLVNLPGVVHGAEALYSLLTSDVPTFRPDATVAVPDGSRLEVLNAIHNAAQKATDTFLLYYAGHGLLTSSGGFNLAASDTEWDRPFTAIPYDDVREALAMSGARRKALVLDCCFSGRAVQGSMGTVAELAAASGTYVLSSTSSARAAIASPSKRYPDFTGMLLDVLERGVEGGPEVLDVQTVYHALKERLASQGSPQPEMTSRGDARLALGLNHAAGAV